MMDDAALFELTRDLAAQAQSSAPSSLLPYLQKAAPELFSQIQSDAKNADLLASWGWSTNVDAGAQAEIVHPTILRAIASLAALPWEPPVFHAGLLHTYGYLLSNLETPFGLKRERWTKGEIAHGFDLPPGCLSPNPPFGSLLQNLTALARHLSMSARPRGPAWISSAKLPGTRWRLEESFDTTNGSCLLRTDFFPFTQLPENSKNQAIIVYSCCWKKKEQLITLFPVSGWMKQKLEKFAAKIQGGAPIRLKYNAVLPGLQKSPHFGSATFRKEVVESSTT